MKSFSPGLELKHNAITNLSVTERLAGVECRIGIGAGLLIELPLIVPMAGGLPPTQE